ncbi:hypothetical protein [Salaquimonas pukyongi]|uniref:hypothetical protein n=1 Tax=Salaquimonas pukyongi TaxID=2712698 RepID=UPI00096B6B17|nr:hypothetical protein [Salaquimonas pukyongi]
MPFSAILSILGLTQKNRHFVSDRKRELNKLTVKYEGLLRQANEELLAAKIILERQLKPAGLDVAEIEEELKCRCDESAIAMAQVEEQREMHLSARADRLSVEQWDELISRRQIQIGVAEDWLRIAKTSKAKIEALRQSLTL